MSKKILYFDYDWTLKDPKTKKVPDKLKKVLLELQEKWYNVWINTANGFAYMEGKLKDFMMKNPAPWIVENWTKIIDPVKKEVIDKKTFVHDQIEKLRSFIKWKAEDILMIWYYWDFTMTYMYWKDEKIKVNYHDYIHKYFEDIDKYLDNFDKISPSMLYVQLTKNVRSDIFAWLEGDFDYHFVDWLWHILPKWVNKWTALLEILEMYPNAIIYFAWNDSNDHPVFDLYNKRIKKIGVWSDVHIKRKANYHAKNPEDLARLLRELFLS